MTLSSWSNFSAKSRSVIDSDLNDNPQLKENRITNKLQKDGFEKVKHKWVVLCSYFRKYPDRFIDFISPDKSKIKLHFYQFYYNQWLLFYNYNKMDNQLFYYLIHNFYNAMDNH